jgi:hypothetical protein
MIGSLRRKRTLRKLREPAKIQARVELRRSAGGAAEGSQGQARGPQRGSPAGVEARSTPPLVTHVLRSSPERVIEKWGKVEPRWPTNLRAPSAREACSANFQGLRAQALAPGYLLSRLRRAPPVKTGSDLLILLPPRAALRLPWAKFFRLHRRLLNSFNPAIFSCGPAAPSPLQEELRYILN